MKREKKGSTARLLVVFSQVMRVINLLTDLVYKSGKTILIASDQIKENINQIGPARKAFRELEERKKAALEEEKKKEKLDTKVLESAPISWPRQRATV